ncbi:hypothetical protein V8J82_18495 [Gymnodinialimonas sp. 2305UL16-5]|uniref:hypothetical protein n=1 Tax=Gymnodinialimonas mytili TaxID=3126503 RepID=UPI0030A1A29E
MDLSIQPPVRPPMADPANSPAAQVPRAAISTEPETARPVEAPETPTLPAPIKGLGIAPLETSRVGDNDDVPRPPEPPLEDQLSPADPRRLAQEARDEIEADLMPDQTISDRDMDARSSPSDTKPGSEAAPTQMAELSRALETLEKGPANPTVDLRR